MAVPTKLQGTSVTLLHVIILLVVLLERRNNTRTSLACVQAAVFIGFASPAAYSDPQAAVLTKLFTRLLTDALNEVSYAAQLAGGFRLSFLLNRSFLPVRPSFPCDDQQTAMLQPLTNATSLSVWGVSFGTKHSAFSNLEVMLEATKRFTTRRGKGGLSLRWTKETSKWDAHNIS